MPNPNMDIKRVADKIGRSHWTVRFYVRAGLIPYYRIGGVRGKLAFDENEVDKWLEQHRHPEVPVLASPEKPCARVFPQIELPLPPLPRAPARDDQPACVRESGAGHDLTGEADQQAAAVGEQQEGQNECLETENAGSNIGDDQFPDLPVMLHDAGQMATGAELHNPPDSKN